VKPLHLWPTPRDGSESELETALARPRYGRHPGTGAENTDGPGGIAGYRHGHRLRSLTGTFGRVEISVPRARLDTAEGKTTEWKSSALRAYQRWNPSRPIR
jgi:putative transposase